MAWSKVGNIAGPQWMQVGSDPGSPTEAEVWWRTDTHRLFVYNGSASLELVPKIKVFKTTTVTVGTSATTITTNTLVPGSYKIRGFFCAVNVGTLTAFTTTLAFSGTATGALSVQAFNATGGVGVGISNGSLGSAVANNTGAGTFTYMIEASIVVTVSGDLTMQATRTAGTSATVQIGATLESERWI